MPSSPEDVRWRQRLGNYARALESLSAAVELAQSRALSDLERQGLIQAFEFTHELAWNVMKDYLRYQGIVDVTGSRDASREAFRLGLVSEGESWMEMIASRNRTTHTYNLAVARDIADRIVRQYHPLFAAFLARMRQIDAQDRG